MDNIETKYHVICSWWLSSRASLKDDIRGLQSAWVFGTFVTDNGVVMCYL